MRTALFIGGPLVLALAVTFLIGSDIVTFGEVSDLEVEQEPIEYREGDEVVTARKLNGFNKYTNITIRMPKGFDGNWKFIFENKVQRDNCTDCNVNTEAEIKGGEMIKIEPPSLVIPAR